MEATLAEAIPKEATEEAMEALLKATEEDTPAVAILKEAMAEATQAVVPKEAMEAPKEAMAEDTPVVAMEALREDTPVGAMEAPREVMAVATPAEVMEALKEAMVEAIAKATMDKWPIFKKVVKRIKSLDTARQN